MDLDPISAMVLIALGVALTGIIGLFVVTRLKHRHRDSQRSFTWNQKQVIITRADGRCEHKLPLWYRCSAPGEHADHVVPWSKGGPTQIFNGQLLCAKHNLRKSNHMPTLLYIWRLESRRRKYALHD